LKQVPTAEAKGKHEGLESQTRFKRLSCAYLLKHLDIPTRYGNIIMKIREILNEQVAKIMKKTIAIIVIMSFFVSPVLFAADTAKASSTPAPELTPSKMSIIQQKVQAEMDRINKSGKGGQNVDKEIVVDKYKKKTTEKPAEDTSNTPKFDMVTLSELNIFGGMFEGGLIGTTIGLVGYSKSMNTDRRSLVTGALIGTFSGAGIAAGLSLYQSISQRYSSSDDYGYDLIGGTMVGAFLGMGGGFISYGKTRHLENVSEGIGWGVLFGACLGLTLGTIETVIPEEYRGISGKLRAFNIEQQGSATVLSCNFKY
jgi:hypothetical protein